MKRLIRSGLAVLAMAAALNSPGSSAGTMVIQPPTSPATALYAAFHGDVRAMLACARDQRRAVVVAHRAGIAPGYAENGLAAADRAIGLIPTMLEIDVVATADGVDFLHHDDDLDRTTTGKGRVDQTRWETVRSLNHRDNGYQPVSSHPVTFTEALAHLGGRAFLMIDLKSPVSSAAIVRQVRAAGVLPGAVFIAYSHQQAREILAADPAALVAIGASTTDQIDRASAAGFDAAPYVGLGGPIGGAPELAETLASRGHFALAGTYLGPDPADARNEAGLALPDIDAGVRGGVQLLVSNHPVALAAYLARNGLSVDPAACAPAR